MFTALKPQRGCSVCKWVIVARPYGCSSLPLIQPNCQLILQHAFRFCKLWDFHSRNKLCRQASDEFQILANSYMYSPGRSSALYFAMVDFDDAQDAFQSVS